MSAINGIFERRGKVCSRAALFDSLNVLSAYGENGSRQWLSVEAGFGHQLTNLFLGTKNEVLPYHDQVTGLVITADVRLDNRSELCDKLHLSQNTYEEIPDSRLLLLAWQKWERKCPAHLIGDYAFAIWDINRKTLFCARDHIGARPFYYSLTPERLVFASDIRGVRAVPGVSDKLDEEYITAFIAKNVYCKERTYLEAIRLLPPGHTLTVSTDSERLERFWFPESVERVRFTKDSEYAEAALEIYTRAVDDRLTTNEKVGVHLTGGLDSSSLAVLVARARRRKNLSPPAGFSWQPPVTENFRFHREYQMISAVCEQENLAPQYCPTSGADVLSILKKDSAREPVEGTMMLEAAVQRQAAADGVRLIFSGWGGDETLSFDGSGYYAELLLRGKWWSLLRESRKFGSSLRFITKQIVLLGFRDYFDGLNKIDNRSWKTNESADSFINAELKQSVRLRNIPCRRTSVRAAMLWYWNWGIHGARMESWAAHGASRGVTYVYPLLDRRLMEFVAGLPPEQFIRGKWRRWIMRKTVENILPEEVCWNQSKDEPAMFERMMKAIYEAYELAGRQLMTTAQMPARARYLDMNKLLKTLQPEVLAQCPRPGTIRRALQFLDF